MTKALLAGIALVAMVVGPPWALLRYIGNPWPDEGVALSAPLTDGAIIGLLAIIVWVLWAQVTACILVEAIAALTDDRVQLEVPFTLGVQQHMARRLITAVVLATVASPIVTPVAPAASAVEPETQTPAAPHAHAAAVVYGHGSAAGPARADQTSRDAAATEGNGRTAPTTLVTVMRLDSLWSIAERHLGDGGRWSEIAALNEGRTMTDGTRFVAADHIRPGWELRVPRDPTSHEDRPTLRAVTVDRGDTLSEISLRELGDAAAYPTLFEASTTVDQPGGAHLTDPDLIRPGWTILVPDAHPREGSDSNEQIHLAGPGDSADRAERAHRQGVHQPPTAQGTGTRAAFSPFPRVVPEPTTPPHPSSRARLSPDRSQEVAEPAPAIDEDATAEDYTVLEALLAAAGCLAAGALGALLTNRRRQIRRRRVGRAIASAPHEVVEVERVVLEHGSAAQPDVDFLDLALRTLAGSCQVAGQPLPQLGAATLSEVGLTLLFTRPACSDAPQAWVAAADNRAWTLPRDTVFELDRDGPPSPYPGLVSIGHDEGGRIWLLDLEVLGVCRIAGEPHEVDDVVRFMVAELALNAWSDGSEILLVDPFGGETVGLNPTRLHRVTRSEALSRAATVAGQMSGAEQSLGADLLTRRRDGLLLDTTHPVVVVATRPDEALLVDLTVRDRSRVVVVCRDEEDPTIVLTGRGTAVLPAWEVELEVFALSAAEVGAMAALLAATRDCEDQPVPAMQSQDGPLGAYARADGSLREEYTEPRHTEGDDQWSMLPDADDIYLAAAASTPEDLAAVAPKVPDATRVAMATLDPTLDQDVTDWFDPSCARPKVHLLGPVAVTALNGGEPASIDNLGATVSFIAYLTCQDQGVTGERAAAACGWKTQRTVQNRATNARFLLGTRPDGSDWLPDASMSAGARRGSSPTYELVRGADGVLNSADLFIRLRHRAERRGDAGGCEEDLVTALSLVTGAPFEAATEYRFRWLFKPGQQRHDEILVGAIHDTAHLLATRAAVRGRGDLVRLACDAAMKASPHSDIAWLDQAVATEADAGRGAAAQLVREKVLDAFDEDLPPRSEAVVERREWGATG